MNQESVFRRDGKLDAGAFLCLPLLVFFAIIPPLAWAFLWEIYRYPGVEDDGTPCQRDWKFWMMFVAFLAVTHAPLAWLIWYLART